jgi:4-amino-4-deoxy-L-arabinose transferase-like glycosyltransferase
MGSIWEKLAGSAWASVLLLAAVAGVMLLPGIGELPLMDRDEPRFANATWEMMERGEWVVPYFNDEYRFDKPPLTYWWMRLHYWAFGKDELGARLHSVVAAWLAAVFLWRLGRYLYGGAAGLLAGLAWLTCLQVMVHGRLCVADMPMILAVVAAMDGLARLVVPGAVGQRSARAAWWQLVAALVVGFLAKGPIAWAVPLLGLILYRWAFFRRPFGWGRLRLGWLSVLVLVGVGLWGVPALVQTGGAFFGVGVGEHVARRGIEPMNGRFYVPGVFYAVTIWLSLMPFGCFLPGALRRQGQELSGGSDGRRAFLLGWFVAPLAIFGLYATQLPHYILPGFPAFFLLLMRGGGLPLVEGKWGKICYWSVFSVVLLLAAALLWLVGVVRGHSEGLADMALASGGILLVLAIGAILLRRGKWASYLGLMGLMSVVLVGNLSEVVRREHPVVRAMDIWEGAPEGTRYRMWGYTEPSLVFYSDGFWGRGGEIETARRFLEEDREDQVTVYLRREWRVDGSNLGVVARILRGEEGVELAPVVDHSAVIPGELGAESGRPWRLVRGVNAAKSSWVELLVVGRGE